MSEATNSTAEARLQEVSAESTGSGRHRGPASHEESAPAARGRHRRPESEPA